LTKSKKYSVSVLTRNINSQASQALLKNHSIRLIEGSYTTESDLRTAFANQDVIYFTIDSFSTGEPHEYFWTFRAYEIAIQSGVKWFIYSGARDKFQQYGYDEKYRNSHNVVAWRLSSWLASQPLGRMKWTIVTGGVYAEMLESLLKPIKDPKTGGVVFKVPVEPESVMPLVPLERYGQRVLWALQHPDESYGRFLSCNPFQVTFPQVADIHQTVTSTKTSFESISIDHWMEGVKLYGGIDPDNTLPRGSNRDDPTAFTFRKSFSAWWAIWRDNRGRKEDLDVTWLDEVAADAPLSLEVWMGNWAAKSDN
jgi:hypothetical protein